MKNKGVSPSSSFFTLPFFFFLIPPFYFYIFLYIFIIQYLYDFEFILINTLTNFL
jgi:hypothetical protein